MEQFAGCFADLDDPRDDNARHDLDELLVIALCVMLCGAEDCSDDPLVEPDSTHTTVDGDHGRIETRTATVSSDIAWLEHHGWPGLAAIGKLTRTRESAGKTTTETAYYLLSAPFTAEPFGAIARYPRGIENSLHWVLDVTMNGDRARYRKDNGPQNLALLRRLSLNLARLEASKGSMKGKLKRAVWDEDFLARLLLQFAHPQMR